jgi:hypothetical protein
MNNTTYLRAQDEPFLRSATLDLHLNVGAKMSYLQDIVCYADSTRTSGARLQNLLHLEMDDIGATIEMDPEQAVECAQAVD